MLFEFCLTSFWFLLTEENKTQIFRNVTGFYIGRVRHFKKWQHWISRSYRLKAGREPHLSGAIIKQKALEQEVDPGGQGWFEIVWRPSVPWTSSVIQWYQFWPGILGSRDGRTEATCDMAAAREEAKEAGASRCTQDPGTTRVVCFAFMGCFPHFPLPLMAKVLFSLVRDLLRRTQAGYGCIPNWAPSACAEDACTIQLQQFPFELRQVKPKQIDFLIINCSLWSGCNQDVVDRWTMDIERKLQY